MYYSNEESYAQVQRFLLTIFEPSDPLLVRHIETWIEAGKKTSHVKGTWHRTVEEILNPPTWMRFCELAERDAANQFFGICPRFKAVDGYDLAAQIRKVRALWADIDGCTLDVARKQCTIASLPPPSITVSSGNGVHLYWLLAEPFLIDDVPDPTEIFKRPYKGNTCYFDARGAQVQRPSVSVKGRHVEDVLRAIASKVSGDHTQDLARLLRLPGTLNRKDRRNGKEPVPCELVECEPDRRYSLAEFERLCRVEPSSGGRCNHNGPIDRCPGSMPSDGHFSRRMQERLEECLMAPLGHRSEADFALCCQAVDEGLSMEFVWSEVEEVGKFAERGWDYFETTWRKAERKIEEKPTIPQRNDHCEEKVIVSASDPLGAAKNLLRREYCGELGQSLWHYQGTFYQWVGNKYVEVAAENLRSRIWRWLGQCWSEVKTKAGNRIERFLPNRSRVDNVLDALAAVCQVPGERQAPCWLAGSDSPDPAQIVAFSNGLLDTENYVQNGEPRLIPHTPNWFSLSCVPHAFDATARCPRWLDFLQQVFEGDQERIQALAQWFGYNLTLDTSQQKMALLVGPPRAGKGTIATVLTWLVGEENAASPSLGSLGGRFGLEPLVGKAAAIVGDGHIGRSSDSIAILERLKSIVGEDRQSIDKKGRPATDVSLTCRFTILVNKMPTLPDASAGLIPRILLFPFEVSFEGKEDTSLKDILKAELPGITNWALQGLKSLRQAGKFLQPSLGSAYLEDFRQLSSPIASFIAECCLLKEGDKVPTRDVQLMWHRWCDENGHHPGSNQSFGVSLKAVAPKVRNQPSGAQRHYFNLALKPEATAKAQAIRRTLHV